MKFTQVIFNTYKFFTESDSTTLSAHTFLVCQNSLFWFYCDIANKFFSINAPLKNYLSTKLALCSLIDKFSRHFLLVYLNTMLNLIVMINVKDQGNNHYETM
jgi:hypothetical protein